MKRKPERSEPGGTGVAPRPQMRRTTAGNSDLTPDFIISDAEAALIRDFKISDTEAKASTANITAEDCAWPGEDGKLDPNKLLREQGYEPESALRLILGAIIDAHVDALGRVRARRIDEAEAVLLGRKRPRGNDPHDDEDMLRELGRRYFKKWLDDPDHKIEVGPIAREIRANPGRDR